jgi:hypothetical protein
MTHRAIVSVLILLLSAGYCQAQGDKVAQEVSEVDKPFLLNYPNIADSDGRVVLTNDIVVLQRLVVPAGMWEGHHSHPGNQIYVHIHGGYWSGRLGGEIVYADEYSEDGAVGWMDVIPMSAGHDSGNTGDTDIDLIYVTLKTDAPVSPGTRHAPQAFPNVETELLLANDRMIVQRVRLNPGDWTGEHGRPGNQVYVVVEGGTWAERRGSAQSDPSTWPAGAVGWLDALDSGEVYEIGNVGETTIEYVLVTIK